MPTIVVVGASGVVGNAALEHFLASGSWDVVAVSRRFPEVMSTRAFRHLAVDLRDRAAVAAALSSVVGPTHLLYTALYEKPGLIAGWTEADQIQVNAAMFQNCLDVLVQSRSLRHVTLLQGTKAYGVHLHPMPIPGKERAPRDDHENFYWLQEDYLRARAASIGFAWTILRPQLIVGRPWGVAMNLPPIIGAFAAICREQGLPFGFPGGVPYVTEAADARLVAEVIEWAAMAPAAVDEVFNVTNGDVFDWRSLWPSLAEALGVELGPDQPVSMATFMSENGDVWDRVVAKHGLRPVPLSAMVGEAHHFADYFFAYGSEVPPRPQFSSRIKLQRAGFQGCYDTEESFVYWLHDLIGRRMLPDPKMA